MAPALWRYQDDMAPKIGRPNKYDWEELTDGSIWDAKQGEDFTSTIRGFRTLLSYQAKTRRLKVKVQARGKIVRFQFSKADLGSGLVGSKRW